MPKRRNVRGGGEGGGDWNPLSYIDKFVCTPVMVNSFIQKKSWFQTCFIKPVGQNVL